MWTLTGEETWSRCRVDVRLYSSWVDTTLCCCEQRSAAVLVSGIWPTIRKPGIEDLARLLDQRDEPFASLLLLQWCTGFRPMDDLDGLLIWIVIIYIECDDGAAAQSGSPGQAKADVTS